MNQFLIAVILGIVEGITEFLPISSTGHLIIVNHFLEFTGQFANMFDIVIQLGAILSVVVYFHKKINPFSRRLTIIEKHNCLILWKRTIAGVIPAIILGALFNSFIEKRLFNPITVGIMLIIGGVFLIFIERHRYASHIRSIQEISYQTAIFIGLIQCLAMIPGTSRSAATIIGALLLGCSRAVAVEFSFYLAIPTMICASGYSLLKSGLHMSMQQFFVLSTGFVISFVVALVVIAFFMSYIRKHDFKIFGWYRIVVGILILVAFSGVLQLIHL